MNFSPLAFSCSPWILFGCFCSPLTWFFYQLPPSTSPSLPPYTKPGFGGMIPWASLCPMPLWIRFRGSFNFNYLILIPTYLCSHSLLHLSFISSLPPIWLSRTHSPLFHWLTLCFTDLSSDSPCFHQTLSIYLSCRAGLCTQHLISLSSSSSSVLRDLSLSVHCITTPLDCSPSHPSITSPSSSYLYLPQFVPLICPSRKLFFIVGLQPSPLDVPWQNTAYSSPLALTAYHVYTVDGTPPPAPLHSDIFSHTTITVPWTCN